MGPRIPGVEGFLSSFISWFPWTLESLNPSQKERTMKPLEIAKNIYWVGAIDWNIRDFHGYSTYQGTTYNAFLIKGEKNVLIDTVKQEFFSEWLDQIREIIDPKKIDWVISNHTELDHSGS